MSKLRLYLSHPFPEREKIRQWELDIEKKLDIELFNPFYDGIEKTLIQRFNSDKLTTRQFIRRLRELSEKVVNSDLKEIAKSDGLLAMMYYPSIGTSCEVFFSSYVLRKPTLIYMPKEVYGFLPFHPWLEYLGEVYRGKRQLISAIKKLKERVESE